jgi:hypothetical protein
MNNTMNENENENNKNKLMRSKPIRSMSLGDVNGELLTPLRSTDRTIPERRVKRQNKTERKVKKIEKEKTLSTADVFKHPPHHWMELVVLKTSKNSLMRCGRKQLDIMVDGSLSDSHISTKKPIEIKRQTIIPRTPRAQDPELARGVWAASGTISSSDVIKNAEKTVESVHEIKWSDGLREKDQCEINRVMN